MGNSSKKSNEPLNVQSQDFVKDDKYKYKENDPKYRGREIDDNLKNGPVEDRGCTDILFCLFFIAFIVGYVIVCIFGFKKGEPHLLASPFDYQARHCGYDEGVKNYPNIYYSSIPSTGNYGTFICVGKCPEQSSQSIDTNQTLYPSSSWQSSLYASVEVGTVCFPNFTQVQSTLSAIDTQLNQLGNTDQWFHDLATTWPILLASLGIALGIAFFNFFLLKSFPYKLIFILQSFINLFLIHLCTGVVIWSVIFLFVIILGLFGGLCWYKRDTGLSIQGHEISSNARNLEIAAIIFWIVDAIFVIIIVCMFKQIKLAVEIFKTTSTYVRSVLEILLVPIMLILVGCLFLLFWFFAIVYVASAGGQKYQYPSTQITNPFTNVLWTQSIKNALVYNLIALIWFIEFFIALGEYVLAHCACEWYFDQTKRKLVRRALYSAIRYHIGSLALGSFVITIVLILRIIFSYIHKQLKSSSTESTNVLLNFWFKCCGCCFDCFERFIRFLNKHAYIYMCLSGKGFCTSAFDGFYLILRNGIRFGALSAVSTIMIELGKVFITALTAFIGYLIITNSSSFSTKIYSPVVPTIFFGVIAYLIASIIFSILGMSAQSILMSFCVDEEIHKKSGSIAQSAPPGLRDLVYGDQK